MATVAGLQLVSVPRRYSDTLFIIGFESLAKRLNLLLRDTPPHLAVRVGVRVARPILRARDGLDEGGGEARPGAHKGAGTDEGQQGKELRGGRGRRGGRGSGVHEEQGRGQRSYTSATSRLPSRLHLGLPQVILQRSASKHQAPLACERVQ